MDAAGLGERLFVTILIILGVSRIDVTGASIGDICTVDSNCNTTIENSECSKMYDCTTGTCACKTGYGSSSGDTCNFTLSGYDEICGSAYYCNQTNQECDSVTSRCACTYWYDYHNVSGECILRSYKILTETCGGWYSIPCLQDLLDSGGECSSTCTCQPGYTLDLTESYTTCREPRWGESCEWLPKCVVSFNTSTVSDDDSSTTPTCTSNVCTCPPSHEHQVVLGYDMCLNTMDGDFVRYSNGVNCTDFNECESFLCVKCPGAESGVCMDQPETNSTNSTTTDVDSHAAVPALYQASVIWRTIPLLISSVVILWGFNGQLD